MIIARLFIVDKTWNQLKCPLMDEFQCRRCKGRGFNPWVRKIPWSKKWHPTPVFLPGKFLGQRALVSYCQWG